MRKPKRLLFLPMLLMLAACAGLGLQAPKTFEERYSYDLSATTGIRESCTRSLDSGAITSADMDECIALADRSRSVLRLARQAKDVGDVSTAEGRLALASGVLTQLETFLTARTKR
jgi:hypothetical protein